MAGWPLYLVFYLYGPARGYLRDTAGQTGQNDYLFFATVTILLIAFLFYSIADRHKVFAEMTTKRFFVLLFLVNFSLLFARPVASNDLFSYIYQSRVWAVFSANPYFTAYHHFAFTDPLYPLLTNSWDLWPTPYGPLFFFLTGPLAWLGTHSYLFSLILFKLFFAAVNFLNAWLLYKIFADMRTVYLYAFNPLIIFEFAINAHNESLVIFFLLLALYFLKKNRGLMPWLAAAACVVLSGLVKYIAFILLPALFILVARFLSGKRKKAVWTLSFVALTCLLIFLAFLPFWQGPDTFWRLIDQIKGLYTNLNVRSPAIMLSAATFYLLGRGDYTAAGEIAGRMMFFAGYLFMLAATVFRPRPDRIIPSFLKFSYFSLALFYLTFFAVFFPWYLTVPICFAIIYGTSRAQEKHITFSHLLTIYGIILYIIVR